MGDIIFTSDNYSIYQNNGYYMCLSNKDVSDYQMFIGFSSQDLGLASNQTIVDEIKKISELLFLRTNDAIYVVPVINPNELERVASINEDKEYDKFLVKYILPVTIDINQKINSNNKRINDLIGMIKQRDVDKKIIAGIDMSVTREVVKNNGSLENADYIREVDIDVLKKMNGINDVEFVETNDNIFHEQPSSSMALVNQQVDSPIQNKENVKVRKLVKPNNNGLPGFSNMNFIIMIISISTLLFGVIIYLLLR